MRMLSGNSKEFRPGDNYKKKKKACPHLSEYYYRGDKEMRIVTL
jgi:hypothetical protein